MLFGQQHVERYRATDGAEGHEYLSENPEVEIQVKADRFRARARTAGAEEKPALWQKMVAEWPSYDEYQERTDREIPVVVLDCVPSG